MKLLYRGKSAFVGGALDLLSVRAAGLPFLDLEEIVPDTDFSELIRYLNNKNALLQNVPRVIEQLDLLDILQDNLDIFRMLPDINNVTFSKSISKHLLTARGQRGMLADISDGRYNVILDHLVATDHHINDFILYRCVKGMTIQSIDVSNNPNITRIPFPDLLRLDASGITCGITDKGIAHLTKLEVLKVANNNKVTTIAPFVKTLTELDCSYESAITDASGATKLTKIKATNSASLTSLPRSLTHLDASFNSSIRDSNLHDVPALHTLYASYNKNITTVAPFARTLRTLYASNTCGIGDAGLLKAINLAVLDAHDNPKITTVRPFATSLLTLNASGNSGIDTNGLVSCTSLEKVNLSRNAKVSRIPLGPSLRELDVSDGSLIDSSQLANVTNLRVLNARNNPNIVNLGRFGPTLTELHASGNLSRLDDVAIRTAVKLTKLYADKNIRIVDISQISKELVELHASESGICDDGLRKAVNLQFLDASNNPNITNIMPFRLTLRELDASGSNCGIDDTGLAYPSILVKIDISENMKITTIRPFAKTLQVIYAAHDCGLTEEGLLGHRDDMILYNYKNHTKEYSCEQMHYPLYRYTHEVEHREYPRD